MSGDTADFTDGRWRHVARDGAIAALQASPPEQPKVAAQEASQLV